MKIELDSIALDGVADDGDRSIAGEAGKPSNGRLLRIRAAVPGRVWCLARPLRRGVPLDRSWRDPDRSPEAEARVWDATALKDEIVGVHLFGKQLDQAADLADLRRQRFSAGDRRIRARDRVGDLGLHRRNPPPSSITWRARSAMPRDKSCTCVDFTVPLRPRATIEQSASPVSAAMPPTRAPVGAMPKTR